MRDSIYLPLLWSVLLAGLAPRLVRGLAPRWAAPALTALALLTALSWLWSCAAVLGLALTHLAPLQALAGLRNVRTDLLPSAVVTDVAAVLTMLALSTTIRRTLQHYRDARHVHRLGHADRAPVVVLADARPRAFAVGGWSRGRIVTTTGLLDALDASGRAVVLAHERAHLRRGHHLLAGLATLSAALDPLLLRLPALVSFCCERDADEVAAAHVGDRPLVARTLARVALLASAPPAGAPGFAVHGVPARVEALLRPPVRPSAVLVACLLALAVATAVSATDVAFDADHLIDLFRSPH